jgi:hypothetical protein
LAKIQDLEEDTSPFDFGQYHESTPYYKYPNIVACSFWQTPLDATAASAS